MMTTEQVRLVRESFPWVEEVSAPVTALFYGRVFELAPEVRPLFRQDIAVQGRKLIATLAVLVDSLEQFEELRPMLKALGQRHAATACARRTMRRYRLRWSGRLGSPCKITSRPS